MCRPNVQDMSTNRLLLNVLLPKRLPISRVYCYFRLKQATLAIAGVGFVPGWMPILSPTTEHDVLHIV